MLMLRLVFPLYTIAAYAHGLYLGIQEARARPQMSRAKREDFVAYIVLTNILLFPFRVAAQAPPKGS